MRGTDKAEVIQVIRTESIIGTGKNDTDLVKRIYQYWSLDGKLLAQNDAD